MERPFGYFYNFWSKLERSKMDTWAHLLCTRVLVKWIPPDLF